MYSAMCFLEDCVLKALDNKQASVQQSHNGCNIGMWAALNELEKQ